MTKMKYLQIPRRLPPSLIACLTLILNGIAFPHNARSYPSIEAVAASPREVTGDSGDTARQLTEQGKQYYETGQYDMAIRFYEQALAIERKNGDRAGEGITLSHLGEVYVLFRENEKATTYLQQALALHREAKDQRWEARTLTLLGTAYSNFCENEKATTYLEQALTLARAIHDQEEEGRILTELGGVALNLANADAALRRLEPALAIRQEVHDRRGEGETLRMIGSVYFVRNQYEQAITYYENALAIAREVHNRVGEEDALGRLGTAYRSLGQVTKALEYYEQALQLARDLKVQALEGYQLHVLGNAYMLLGQRDKALAMFNPALVIVRALKDRCAEAALLSDLALTRIKLGQYDQATAHLENALLLFRGMQIRSGERLALGNLAQAYFFLSQYEKAITYSEPALAIARDMKDRQGEALSLVNLGVAYLALSQYEKAITYIEPALDILREIKDRRNERTALNNLSQAYAALSQHDKVITYLTLALEIAREVKDRAGEGVVLNNLGVAYQYLSQYETAITSFEQALVIAREVKDRAQEATVLGNLGAGNHELSRYEQAIVYHEQALVIAREVKNRKSEGVALNNLGMAYLDLGQQEKARNYLEQALTILREVKDREQEATTLGNFMTLWKGQGKPRLAIFYGKQAVNAYQEIRGDIQGLQKGMQQSYLTSKEGAYRILADLLITAGRLPEAEEVLRLLKQEELYEFVRRDAKAVDALARLALTKTEEQWARRYLEIADHLTAMGQEVVALQAKQQKVSQLSPAEEERLLTLNTDLQAARQARAAFLQELEVALNDSQEAGKRLAHLETSTNLQETLRTLGTGTVAVYTVVGKDKSWVMLVGLAVQKAYEVPVAAQDLNRKVLAFRHALQTPSLDPRPLGKELYDLFVQPLVSDLETLQAQTVMWSLDGVLRYLPIAALYDGRQYVIERYRTTVFTLAGQSFLTTAPQARWRAAGLGVSKAQAGFGALPDVPGELRAIIRAGKAAGGVLPGSIQLDGDFTVRALQMALTRRVPVVHLASHFQFKPGNETESFLLLGDGTKLSIAELTGLSFGGVELLTLSACATALGSEGTGKEVESFAALAQKSGAQAVVASLWPVADASTKELMQTFYRNREAKKGVSKAEALRQAQLALLRGVGKKDGIENARGVIQVAHASPHPDGRSTMTPPFQKDPTAPFAHPHYWAPFILIGNWR